MPRFHPTEPILMGSRTTGMGQEEQSPPPRSSVGSRFSKRTLAGTRPNGRATVFRLGLGSPIGHAASRLALRATAPRAAAVLTRHARRALGSSDGRHGVSAGVFVDPAIAIAENGIKGGEHFAHDR